ncbi:ubiquinone anaerobic biosynthesis accessory factor UbiT [Tistlia consotensis]|uniref:ubiquinone anaerobic biosynthesis accessory factor UbiT n=1 Tax=Tistlia consotensis TaxID=1321365 RepID=UPI00190EABE8|nr:SCP2 sterol-binding domain-containing protein [Tistlia consotensis]
MPPRAAELLALLPRPALRWALQRLVAGVGRRHPDLFERLGEHASATFLIDPTDLPVAVRLWPRPEGPQVEIVGRPVLRSAWHARIAGPLAALLGMIHGRLDGDALFFSRDLAIEGDTEAVLALRNALDDAELDLPDEAAACLGPLSPLVARPAGLVVPLAERMTGVALSRAGRPPL